MANQLPIDLDLPPLVTLKQTAAVIPVTHGLCGGS